MPTPRSPVTISELPCSHVEPLEQDVEGLDLLVAAVERRRLGAGAGRVGVSARVHYGLWLGSVSFAFQTRRNLLSLISVSSL